MKWGGGDRERLKRKFTKGKEWVRPLAIESLDQPGNLYCLEPEVEDIRRQLLARNIAPKIALKSEMEVKSMSYNKTTITVLPAMWQQIEQWMQKLGMTPSPAFKCCAG